MLLEHFHFIRPEWFLALIPLMVIVLAIRYLHKQQSGWNKVLASHLYQHLVSTNASGRKTPPLFLLMLGWTILVIALAGPTWEKLPQPVYQLNTGKVVVIDMSMSMRATDIQPDRLTRAKYKAIDLVNTISEGETGLVAYAGDAFTISPLSTDGQNLTALIPSLAPEIMPVAGSEPYLGLKAAVDLLKNAGFTQGEIFWITDGLENDQIAEVRELIAANAYRVSILAVGTEAGAPIKMLDGELMKDATGAIVLPRLNSSRLKSMAALGNGRYAPLQASDDDIQFLISQQVIDREAQESEGGANNQGDEWKEMGPFVVLLLLPLAAYGFRRGILPIVIIGLFLPGFSPDVHANWWQDMWKTSNQQGQEAFKQQQFNSAAETFEDPNWKGAAHYKNGDYEAALEAFSQSDSIDATYNRGNTLAQLGDLDRAINAYDEVIKQDPTHADAIANKALLEQQKQQQEQQNQDSEQEQQDSQDQESQDQDSEQQQDSQQSDQQSDQKDQEQQQSQDQSQQQDSQQQEPDEQSEGQQQENEQQQENDQDASEQQEQQESSEQQAQMQEQERELTDEEKEQMQRLQNLLRKVPDDPGFLLKQKMLREHHQRKRERMPTQLQRNW